MIITSLITIFSVGTAGLQTQPPTLGVYEQMPRLEFKTDADIPSVVAWQKMSREKGFEFPVAQGKIATIDPEIIQAFDKIGLPETDGKKLLNRAKEILSATSYSCTKVVPIIASDLEEGVSYLTLRLYVDASMEKAFELDSALTRGLISSFPRLPVRLSFAVYENEAELV